jgi:hypothetical protein
VSARERLATWLLVDRDARPDGDQRFGGNLAIAYERAPLTRADLEDLLIEPAVGEQTGVSYRQAVIARMRTLVRQREAALALHQPDGGDESRAYSCCEKCGDAWPCPTAASLGAS